MLRSRPRVLARRSIIVAGVLVAGLFGAELFGAERAAADPARPGGGTALVHDRVVAGGGPDDAVTVRHLRLEGSNEAIGRALATLARTRHGYEPRPVGTPLRNRVYKAYLADVSPPLAGRMRGVAAAYGLAFDDDRYAFHALPFEIGIGGCSIVYYPPAVTETGRGVMSRNYDFSTGTLTGRRPPGGEGGATSRPYVVEMYPDEGYASIYLCAYDLLGGTLDGINAEGLTVALAADDETSATGRTERPRELQVGLGELHIARHLLDTCKNVEEAKAALLRVKHHYAFVPCHYIVADRSGRSFVWAYTYSKNREHIVDGDGPQVLTNHAVHGGEGREVRAGDSYDRMREISARIAASGTAIDRERMAAICREVSPVHVPPPGSDRAPVRTLWHALYYPDARAVEVDFYVGETIGADGVPAIRRSGYLRFALDEGLAAEAAPAEAAPAEAR